MAEIVQMIAAHHEAIITARFERAFETSKPRNFTAERTTPKTYAPVAPKLPWYLDPNGVPPLENP